MRTATCDTGCGLKGVPAYTTETGAIRIVPDSEVTEPGRRGDGSARWSSAATTEPLARQCAQNCAWLEAARNLPQRSHFRRRESASRGSEESCRPLVGRLETDVAAVGRSTELLRRSSACSRQRDAPGPMNRPQSRQRRRPVLVVGALVTIAPQQYPTRPKTSEVVRVRTTVPRRCPRQGRASEHRDLDGRCDRS